MGVEGNSDVKYDRIIKYKSGDLGHKGRFRTEERGGPEAWRDCAGPAFGAVEWNRPS